ncbi:SMP-30/gluconolactonase/LRE family protein [Janibacter cremeus]|uniref:Sugar lactone lactonase YvrE n=1 Tax=Janibacter cremeus TaxID=1285192 RepID=A0A852VU05_9MICO|nr:SMP-30/gluconolactonase/LRE family protein [Janibacter cremeus]NYF98153.1 sugar lactone lactonase YvrE [Janibacter cremeus]
MRAERLTDALAHHAEGPCWWPGWGGLRWVDMTAGDVLALHASGEVSRTHVGDVAAMIRPRSTGGAVIALERGLAFADEDWRVGPLPAMWTTDTVRMNEGGVAPDGSLYVGSMAYDQAKGAARLYRVHPGGEVETALESVTVSNGIDFSPDSTRAYYNDTPTGRIALFDFSPEDGLAHGRVLAEVDGHPDGLTVDGEGGVWTAIFGGSRVERWSPDGTRDAVVEVGARQVTACTFGGADLDELYITTSREGLDEGEDPAAGSLFVVRPGVRGKAVTPFAG